MSPDSENRLSVSPDGKPTPFSGLTDIPYALMSFTALKASYRTLTASPSDSPFVDQKGYIDFSSRQRLAINVLVDNVKKLKEKLPPYHDAKESTSSIHYLQNLASFAAGHHIKLIVYVHPLHASLVDHYTEDWPAYCRWMKDVTTVMATTPGLEGTFWDFTGYNEISTEPFPLPSDQLSAMKYYIEVSHYKAVVGNMVIDKIWSNKGPANFGFLVTPETVDQDLDRIVQEKAAWHSRAR